MENKNYRHFDKKALLCIYCCFDILYISLIEPKLVIIEKHIMEVKQNMQREETSLGKGKYAKGGNQFR